MELKTSVITKTIIDSEDLDKFVCSKYGDGFEFTADLECNSSTFHEFNIPMKYQTERDIREMKEVRKGNYPKYCANLVLQCLFEDGFIPACEYTVECRW